MKVGVYNIRIVNDLKGSEIRKIYFMEREF